MNEIRYENKTKTKEKYKTKTRRKTIQVYFILLGIMVGFFIIFSAIKLLIMFTLNSLMFLVIFIALSIFAGYIGCIAYRNIGEIEGKKERITKEKYDSLMDKIISDEKDKIILFNFYKPMDEKRMPKDEKKMFSGKDPWDELKNDIYKSMSDSEGDEN